MKRHKVVIIISRFFILLTLQTRGILSEAPSEDPIVGLGLLTPIIRTVNHVVTAPVRNRARKMRHRHLLRADNPMSDDGPVMEDAAGIEEADLNEIEEDLQRLPRKMKNNNMRDEEYYLWSLNNWVPFGRTAESVAIDDIYEYNKGLYEDRPEVDVQLLANPDFYRHYEVVPSDKEMRNIIPKYNGLDRFEGVPIIEIVPEMLLEDYNHDESGPVENQQQYGDFQEYYNENIKDNGAAQEVYQENSVVPEGTFVEPPKFEEQSEIEDYNPANKQNYSLNHENRIIVPPGTNQDNSYNYENNREYDNSDKEMQQKTYQGPKESIDYSNSYQEVPENEDIYQQNENYINNLQDIFPAQQEMNKNGQERSDFKPIYESYSRSANPTDPRHFHVHQHSSTFNKWFYKDKPTFTDESSSVWDVNKQPQIVINNHNVPVNVNNHNSQIAQTSGHSTSSQSQSVSNKGINSHDFSNQNFQGSHASQGSTSAQSQTVSNQGQVVPQRLFVSNELSTNTQAAKTSDGSTSNQAQSVQGNSGQNNQFAVTSEGSQSSQSQTVLSRRVVGSPFLVDVPSNRPANHKFSLAKRSLPLVRLMTDPNAKLDMPKTLENFGTVARNSFQDKRHPMYHMKNMVGSARDVFLSALRVPPQGIVIPSQYKIVDLKKEKAVPINNYAYLDNVVDKLKSIPDEAKKFVEPIVGSAKPQTVKEKIQERINNLRNSLGPKVKSRSIFQDDSPYFRSKNTNDDDDEQFNETFQKMGNIFRESIQSGQQTLNHINDVAHSARKAFTTSTLGAPRVVRPLMHAPAFEKKLPRFRDDPEKVTFVAPRFLDVTNDGRPKETADDFIDVGDIMNAFGVSNPSGSKVGLRRYVVHSKVDQEGPVVGNRFGEANEIVKDGPAKKQFFIVAEDIDDGDEVSNEIDIIKDLTDVLGVNSLKELLSGMKTDLTYMKDKVIENKYKELEVQQEKLRQLEEDELTELPQGVDKVSSDEDIDQFIKSLFTTPAPVNENHRPKRQLNHQHHNLALPANLLRPFMGSPSRIELNDYFKHHNDFEEVQNNSPEDLTSEEVLQSQQDQFVEALFDPNEYIRAINPKMYMKIFNEPLVFQDKYPKLDLKKTKDMVKNHNLRETVGDGLEEDLSPNGRISMTVKDKLLKPYMGKKEKGFSQSYVDYVPDFGYLPNGYNQYGGDSSEENEDSDEYY